ncbi:MAG: FAD-binding domain-containing protein [Pacificimonas sp.]
MVPGSEFAKLMTDWTPTRAAALAHFDDFLPQAGRAYQNGRNHDPGPDGPHANSQLSPWLSHRLLTEADVLSATLAEHSQSDAYKFISEVLWRCYFQGHLEWQPSVWRAYVEDRDAAFARLDEDPDARQSYERAVAGESGIAPFDAWAKELFETNFLHNHTRMWFSSIWIFTLGLDWTLGADFFLRHLLDGDAASNTCNWRWTAGLHTKGKTYLATAANIRRYTDGRFDPRGLAASANALTEDRTHERAPPSLPAPEPNLSDKPFALLVHEQEGVAETLDLGGATPALVIGVTRPEARSPASVSPAVLSFSNKCIDDALARAGTEFGCPTIRWDEAGQLAGLLGEIETLAVPYIGHGWLRDEVRDELNEWAAAHDVVRLIRPLDRAVWPHAKAGYYGVKKKMDDILATIAP